MLVTQVPLMPMPPRLEGREIKQINSDHLITQDEVDIFDTMLGLMNKVIETLPVLTREAQ